MLGDGNIISLAETLIPINQKFYLTYLDVVKKAKPDLIIYDLMSSFGKDIARKLNIKSVCFITHFPSSKKSSLHSLPIMLDSIKESRKLKQIQDSFSKFRQEQGLPKAVAVWNLLMNRGDITLIFSPKEFIPFPDSYGKNVYFVGTTIKERRKEQNQKYEKYNIYVSFGTVHTEDTELFHQIISSQVIQNHKTIMSVGELEMKPSPNITFVKKTQQIALLENCDLFINHGGLNSVQESIYCGVPQIIIPKITERKQIADNVAKKKLGICLDQFDEKKVKKFIENLDTYKKNVREYQSIFQNYDAPKTSVKLIKQLLEK